MPPIHKANPDGQILIAPPAPIQQAISAICALRPPATIVLAVPPMICAGCGKPRSLFANQDGRTVCVSDCATPGSIDG